MRKILVIYGSFQYTALTTSVAHMLHLAKISGADVLVIPCLPEITGTKEFPFSLEVLDKYWSKKLKAINSNIIFHPVRVDYRNDVENTVHQLAATYFSQNCDFLYANIDTPNFQESWLQPVDNCEGKTTHMVEKFGAVNNVNEDFMRGVAYKTNNYYPITYPVVDVIVRKQTGEVLMGTRTNSNKLRFPGGFVDPTDVSLEMAAKRELFEECGAFETSKPVYIGSRLLNDRRYMYSDRMMTNLFVCDYVFGRPVAGDDLASVVWVDLKTLDPNDVVPNHRYLIDMYKESALYI